MIPQELQMRREPRQQRTLEIIRKIEQATLELLREGGVSQLNTNAIAERSGVDIKSLYRFFPNKEAIIHRLVQRWLADIRARETAIYAADLGLVETWDALEDMIDAVDQEHSGYGVLWSAMDMLPALNYLEQEHELVQLENLKRLLRKHGCQWPERQLNDLARYVYRTWDLVKQGSIEQGEARGLIWQVHKSWQRRLLRAAVASRDAAELQQLLG